MSYCFECKKQRDTVDMWNQSLCFACMNKRLAKEYEENEKRKANSEEKTK
jgi:hypothetical protein